MLLTGVDAHVAGLDGLVQGKAELLVRGRPSGGDEEQEREGKNPGHGVSSGQGDPKAVLLHDADRDGRPDLLVADACGPQGDQLRVGLNDGNGGFTLAEVEYDPSNPSGADEKTVLVSVIAAQNEIGTLQPVTAIGEICKEHGVLFHTDAAQAVGRIPLDVQRDGIDLLAVSSHKVYGPKGVGALFVRRRDPRVRLAPLMFGGGQERDLRPGTLNVPGIAAFGDSSINIDYRVMTRSRQARQAYRPG